jgi:hypothetical protein
MAYSATLANIHGLLSEEEMKRIHTLFSRCGLSMDHHDFNEDILEKATQAILKTRDGKLRAAVPNPLGSCAFINDVGKEELAAALRKHKELMKGYPRNGEGLEASLPSRSSRPTSLTSSRLASSTTMLLPATRTVASVPTTSTASLVAPSTLRPTPPVLRSTASLRTVLRTVLPVLSTATALSTAMLLRAAVATRVLCLHVATCLPAYTFLD